MVETTEILKDRGKAYGSFDDVAIMAQNIKNTMRASDCWGRRTPTEREAIDMIVTKLARAICGSGSDLDTWLDIEGYAKLVSERIPVR